jgi:hypothetical protein
MTPETMRFNGRCFLYQRDYADIETRQLFREETLNLSITEGISLATPLTHILN